MPSSRTSQPAYAEWRDGTLTLGNALFQETWRAEPGGRLRLVSFQRAGGLEWVSTSAPARPSPESDPLSAPAPSAADAAEWTARTTLIPPTAPQDRSLTFELRLDLAAAGLSRRHQFRLHPDAPGAIHQVFGAEIDIALAEFASTTSSRLTGSFRTKPNGQMFAALPDIAEPLFSLAPRQVRVRDAVLVDQTDHHSELVFEREWLLHPGERCLPLQANLVCLEEAQSSEGEGFAWLLLAPLRHVRARWSAYFDFLFAFQSGRLVATACPAGYAVARIPYTGGRAGATLALHDFQRAFYQPVSPRPPLLLSNTWGDRAGAKNLSEAFVLREIESARALGVEIVQVDDGWQRGATVNTVVSGGVWNGFWAADPEFWTPHRERFPRGLAPLVEAAAAAGVKLGLWYAPDSTNDLANWERDAAELLKLWREHHVTQFKLDALKLHTRLAETRFHALCDRVQQGSGGQVSFDFDATAEHRPTYWGRPGGGTLFLENRFTEQAGYHPHATLRALWSLAHFIRPHRIRVEFLNPARNEVDYRGDPLRPAAYPPEYLFAITMAASPLAWFEISRVPPAIAAKWAPLISVWKEHRDAFHAGHVLPIGQKPDGFSWTGFVSHAPTAPEEAGDTYMLLFRELTTRDCAVLTLPRALGWPTGTAVTLAGEGTVSINDDGALAVQIPRAQQFLFARLPRTPASLA